MNYCAWDPREEHACSIGTARTYCHPKYYDGLPNSLYHNNGDGTFTDVSAASGIAAHVGKGMGLSFLDFDQDGRLDVFVANDTAPNFLFRNAAPANFVEVALEAGVALNNDGRAVSSMGVDSRDLDNDGREDLFVTANDGETFPSFAISVVPCSPISHPAAESAARRAPGPAGAPGSSISITTA